MKKYIYVLMLGGICCMLFSCSHHNMRQATWLWDATLLHDEEDVITFLTTHQFNTVFVQVDEAVSQAVYASFIARAHEESIAVYALDGSPIWATDEALPTAYFDWLTRYATTFPNAPFDGVHLDVEPYLHDDWANDRAYVIERFQQMMTRAATKAATLGLLIEADLPFWFDEVLYDNAFGKGNVAQWVIEQLDGVTLMAYRDNADDIVRITKQELAFAKAARKSLTIGVETMASDEGAFVSFYGRDVSYVTAQLQNIRRAVDEAAFRGFAIHHYNSYKQLVD